MLDPEVETPSLRASVVQFEPVPQDADANLRTVRRLAEQAAGDGAPLVIFPEMCLIGYWYLRRRSAEELRALSEPGNGPHLQAVRELAAELGIGIGVGLLERDAEQLFNSYAVCLPDG